LVCSAVSLNLIRPDFYRFWRNIVNFIGLEEFIETIRKSLIKITCSQLNYSENFKEREHLEVPDVDRTGMLVHILITLDSKAWSEFSSS
jgi:hypothetical protein